MRLTAMLMHRALDRTGHHVSRTHGYMERLLQQFEVHLSCPEQYLSGSNELKINCLELNQELFSHCNSGRFPAGPLSALHTKGFDNDQVWEQIQLLNQPTMKYAKKRSKEIGKVTAGYSAMLPQAVDNDEQNEMELRSESSCSSDEYSKRTGTDGDRFFSISKMNQFLQEEDHKYESRQLPAPVDDFDMFREMSSEDEGDQLMYDDFFDPPNDDFDHDNANQHHDDDLCGNDHNLDHGDLDHDFGNDEENSASQYQSTHQKHQQKVYPGKCVATWKMCCDLKRGPVKSCYSFRFPGKSEGKSIEHFITRTFPKQLSHW